MPNQQSTHDYNDLSSEPSLINHDKAIFPGALTLLKEALVLYKRKFLTILGIILPLLVVTILGDRFIAEKFITGYSTIYYVITFTLSYLVTLWSTAALLCAIKNETGNISAIEAYRQSAKKLLSYILLVILLSFIVFGGFLLAVIPGVVFFIWFSLASVILIIEDEGIIASLLKSKEYVRHRWLSIAWRHIFVIVVVAFTVAFTDIVVIDSIITAIGLSSGIAEGYSSLFVAPLVIIYSFLVYQYLKHGEPKDISSITPVKTKIIFILAGAIGMPIVASLFVISFLAYVFVADAPAPDDSDLRLLKVSVANEDNAFYDLENIKDDIVYYPSDQTDLIINYMEDKKWDEIFVQDLLYKNELAFKYLDQAKAKSKFQDPTKIINGSQRNVPNPMLFINMAKLDSLRSLYLFKDGKEQLALDNAVQLTLLAQKIHDSQSDLLYYLIARPLKSAGLERINQIIAHSVKLSPDILIYYARQLDDIENSNGLKKAFIIEYLNQLNNFASVSNMPSSYYFKPNKVKQLLVDNAKIWVSSVEASCASDITFESTKKTLEEAKQFSNSLHSITGLIRIPFTENIIGKFSHIVIFIAIDPSSMRFNKCNDDAILSATQLLFALKTYNIDYGDLPLSLDALVPKYISEIPTDPFDGRPMKYSKEKKIIWSVGKDSVDSGGSIGDDWREMPDPTFSVDFGTTTVNATSIPAI